MILSPLYHWAPVDRRAAIRNEGLRLHTPATTCSDASLTTPYVCLSPRPSMAWSLSGGMDWVSEIEDWDLWEVRIPAHAETHVRPLWGDEIEEVKVYTPIPADCLWWVGQRSPKEFEGSRVTTSSDAVPTLASPPSGEAVTGIRLPAL